MTWLFAGSCFTRSSSGAAVGKWSQASSEIATSGLGSHLPLLGIDQINLLIIFPTLCIKKIASLGQIGEREERCRIALFFSLGSCSRSNICLGLLGVELENLVNTKAVEYFNTFLSCI
jgi:hypothetical protein